MAKRPSSVARFKRVEFAIRDVFTALRELEKQIDLANTSRRTEVERNGLGRIRNDCGPLIDRVRQMQATLVDIPEPADPL